MGSRVRIELAGADRDGLLRRSEHALGLLADWESRISTWRPSSEYSRVNRSEPGRSVRIEPSAALLLSEALDRSRETGGAFTPAVGALIEAWDLRGEGRRPAPAELEGLLHGASEPPLSVDPSTGSVTRTTPTALIDAGAFGKGGALREVALALAADDSVQRALVDLGGQLWAKSPRSEPWLVQIAHPAHRDRAVGTLRLTGASVATSGSSERSVLVDGERYGHILDPRTGHPAPAWGSVTVVADDPFEADVLATALFVMGPEAGPRWIAEHRPTLAALFLIDTPEGLSAVSNGPMTALVDEWSADVTPIEPTPKG